MKLVIYNDAGLSAAVAEYVALLPVREDVRMSAPPGAKVICLSEEYGVCKEMPPFAASADAVLPLLEREPYGWGACRSGEADGRGEYTVKVYGEGPKVSVAEGKAFARTACLALLRAADHEVIFA